MTERPCGVILLVFIFFGAFMGLVIATDKMPVAQPGSNFNPRSGTYKRSVQGVQVLDRLLDDLGEAPVLDDDEEDLGPRYQSNEAVFFIWQTLERGDPFADETLRVISEAEGML